VVGLIRSLSIILALCLVSSLIAYGVYSLEFGVSFDINANYFPKTFVCRELYASGVQLMTWVACFSTISLVYVLYRNRKVNK
jgi:hypothetical protein